MEPRQVPGVVAIVVGVLVVAVALQLPSAYAAAYPVTAEPVAVDDTHEDTPLLNYTELSAESQTVLDEARTSDGETTIYGRENVPDELLENDEAWLDGHTIQVLVHHDDAYTELTVTTPGEPIGIGMVYVMLSLFGIVTALVGYGCARERLPYVPTLLVLAGLYALYRIVASPRYPLEELVVF